MWNIYTQYKYIKKYDKIHELNNESQRKMARLIG